MFFDDCQAINAELITDNIFKKCTDKSVNFAIFLTNIYQLIIEI